jgi:hypothetical protein
MRRIFFVHKDAKRAISQITHYLELLSKDGAKTWKVEIGEHEQTRSNEQNRYLWGVVYPIILASLPGWDADDVHEYFLGEHYGWETLEGLGRKRLKPLRRSSKLSTKEFKEHCAFIQRAMAERGVDIPDPNEARHAA